MQRNARASIAGDAVTPALAATALKHVAGLVSVWRRGDGVVVVVVVVVCVCGGAPVDAHVAQMQAVAVAGVPKLSLLIGDAVGAGGWGKRRLGERGQRCVCGYAGYYAAAGRPMQPRCTRVRGVARAAGLILLRARGAGSSFRGPARGTAACKAARRMRCVRVRCRAGGGPQARADRAVRARRPRAARCTARRGCGMTAASRRRARARCCQQRCASR